MARINLLPWREERREQRRRAFLVLIGAAVGATLLVGIVSHIQIEHMIGNQQARNGHLQQEIAKLDRQIREIKALEETKARLLARMDVIQQLQRSRPEIVHLFDELVATIPDGVFLTSIDQEGGGVVLEGRAQSNARVSAFMRNIEASGWVGNPLLLLIENKEKTGDGLSRFRLRLEQRRPNGQNAAA
ncbi:PilN domain-containing protein [Thiococcus pfennigii]|jgi:type IV pilus assembly protein PilN|uniref:PilN domain-containing protein n=1 Tax=Thiococcus pfennigii TaxID=1057 RepID=UPI0019047AAD|nr:PilN domain-containing protein [Thiococcus pfennigii]MBK1702560.1 pilus assembly protein PilN [Thiococcus pfennigii]MBK1732660.1 pilus assembly protein PilN [Thiococcus pfennigii]